MELKLDKEVQEAIVTKLLTDLKLKEELFNSELEFLKDFQRQQLAKLNEKYTAEITNANAEHRQNLEIREREHGLWVEKHAGTRENLALGPIRAYEYLVGTFTSGVLNAESPWTSPNYLEALADAADDFARRAIANRDAFIADWRARYEEAPEETKIRDNIEDTP